MTLTRILAILFKPSGSKSSVRMIISKQARSMEDAGENANMSLHVMNGFRPEMVSVYNDLVREFAVCDRWFASVPASTQPNRLYVHSATSHGATGNLVSNLVRGYPQRTIFENVHDAGLSFGIYYQNIPATLFYRNLRKLKFLPKFHQFEPTFFSHAASGRLPNYVVIEQRYLDSKDRPANDDHPSHDVYEGQMLVKNVYEALRSSPQWNQTLLVITYDEHGGYYDHVPTPASGVPSPDDIVGPGPFFFKFDRLGVRVPAIFVSPWIEKGTVVHGPNGKPFPTSEFEHSSIPATVRKLFNLPFPFLTRRDTWAGTFDVVLQRKEARTDCPTKLSIPLRIRKGEANENARLSEFQQELMQLTAALTGDHVLAQLQEKIAKSMTVKEGLAYMDSAVARFFEAGLLARKMGVNEEQIVQMKPSLTTRPPARDP
ncbi:non-specific phospholipase C2-like isoform X2 [Wolffia australiana]